MTDNNFLVPQTKSETIPAKKLPCPFSPAGMLQPSHLQPPPMFGPRGRVFHRQFFLVSYQHLYHLQGQLYLRSTQLRMHTSKSIVHINVRLCKTKRSMTTIAQGIRPRVITITLTITNVQAALNHRHQHLANFGVSPATETFGRQTCYRSI